MSRSVLYLSCLVVVVGFVPSTHGQGKTKPITIKGTLNANDPKESRRNRPHKVHDVKLVKGVVYQVDLTGGFDTFLFVETADKKLMAYNDDFGGMRASRVIIPAPKTGKYRVIVSGYGKNDAGQYTLTIRPRGKAKTLFTKKGKLTINDPAFGMKTKHHQKVEVKLKAGKTYLIDMAIKQGDAYLYLVQNGKTVASNDDVAPMILDSRIRFDCQKAGTYTIIAGCFGDKVGAYTLKVTELP